MNVSNLFWNPLTTTGVVAGAQFALNYAPVINSPFTTTLQLTALVAFVADAAARVAGDILKFSTNTQWKSANALSTLRDAGAIGLAAWGAQWLNNNVLVNYVPTLGTIDNNGTLVVSVAVFLARFGAEVLKEIYDGLSTSKPATKPI